jgi:hypothetical protein
MIENRAKEWRGLRACECIERIFDVGCRNAIAVGKTRQGIDVKKRGSEIRLHFDIVRDQRVFRRELIPTALHQRVEHQVTDVRGRRATQQERIQRIVALQLVVVAEVQHPVGGCVRVGVVEMGEIGGIARLAELGDRRRGAGCHRGQDQRGRGDAEYG